MAYSRRMVERARALRGAGLTVMEITEILGGPGKTSVWRWIRDVHKPAGRAGGGMDLPRLVGDGPDYPDIDPEDKDALIERLRLENAVLRAVQDVLKPRASTGCRTGEDPGDRPPEACGEVVLERTHRFLEDIEELL